MAQTEIQFPALTGVRFLLVTQLFLYHYIDRLGIGQPVIYGITNQFYLAPNMFFVLSGFIICVKYFDEIGSSRRSLKSYYIKRVAKIYPNFFALTMLTYLVAAYDAGFSGPLIKEWILNITLLKGFSESYFLSGIGPSWSLAVEEVFYLVSPFIFLIIRKRNLLFGQLVFWWMAGALLLFLCHLFPNDGFFGSFQFVYFATFFGRCFEFYCGIYLALLILGRRPKFFLRMPAGTWPVYTISGLAWMTIGIGLLYGNQYWNDNLAVVKILLSNLFFPVGVAIFYWGLINEKTWFQRFLTLPVLQLLGRSSYAFFLVHTGIIAVGLEKYLTRNPFLLYLLLQLISVMIFLWFERPLSRWIRNRFLVRKAEMAS